CGILAAPRKGEGRGGCDTFLRAPVRPKLSPRALLPSSWSAASATIGRALPMELLLNSEQTMLKDSATSFARRSAGAARLRALPDLPARFPAQEFAETADAGWLSLLLPEEQEGSGLGLTELCLVAEQLGAALSALPVVAASGGIVALAGDLSGSNTL